MCAVFCSHAQSGLTVGAKSTSCSQAHGESGKMCEKKQKMLQLETDISNRTDGTVLKMSRQILEQLLTVCAALLSPEVRRSITDIFTLRRELLRMPKKLSLKLMHWAIEWVVPG